MGSSRVSGATVGLTLLVTSLAHAEPTPAALAPSVVAPANHAVPIELRGSEPGLRLEIQDPRNRSPLALCTDACQATIVPGRYRLFVNATADTRAGAREVQISEPSQLLVTPRSEGRYTTGLTLGIGGPVLMVLGSVLFLSSIGNGLGDGGSSASDGGQAAAGLGMLVGGIVITPIGWVMFGTSLRPKVEVTPLPR
jgi:hypothetical protein